MKTALNERLKRLQEECQSIINSLGDYTQPLDKALALETIETINALKYQIQAEMQNI